MPDDEKTPTAVAEAPPEPDSPQPAPPPSEEKPPSDGQTAAPEAEVEQEPPTIEDFLAEMRGEPQDEVATALVSLEARLAEERRRGEQSGLQRSWQQRQQEEATREKEQKERADRRSARAGRVSDFLRKQEPDDTGRLNLSPEAVLPFLEDDEKAVMESTRQGTANDVWQYLSARLSVEPDYDQKIVEDAMVGAGDSWSGIIAGAMALGARRAEAKLQEQIEKEADKKADKKAEALFLEYMNRVKGKPKETSAGGPAPSSFEDLERLYAREQATPDQEAEYKKQRRQRGLI